MGSANNQFESDADADSLAELGALDYVVNAAGALAFELIYQGERDVTELERRVRGVGDALDEIFAEAAAEGESPLKDVERRVRLVLDAKNTG